MITVRFDINSDVIVGFEVEGHSGFVRRGRDIVCAAVSSAALMTANTVTDILGLKAEAFASDGYMMLKLNSDDAQKAQSVLRGFELHIRELSEQYKRNISLIYSEV